MSMMLPRALRPYGIAVELFVLAMIIALVVFGAL
jgi:hypothetical protein